ncbi:MAG: exosortase-associated EpsI family protein [Pirellulales bacterium]
MNQILSLTAAAVILVAGALMQGKWTERWVNEPPEEVDRWVQRLDDVPLVIGDWRGEVGESDERQLQVAKAAGGTSVAYKNQLTGEIVSVFLVAGRGRYVANHTPDKCYVAAGYNMGQTPQLYEVVVKEYEKSGQVQPEFYTARFSKEEPDHSEHLRILWAWSDGNGWDDASATAPVMYKMYVISPMVDHGEPIEDSAAKKFVDEALPAIDAALFPQDTSAAPASATPPPTGDDGDGDTKSGAEA